jgi:hypothetical protein
LNWRFWSYPVTRSRIVAHATGGKHYIETVWDRGYVLRDPVETYVRMPATANTGGNPGVRSGSAAA